MTSTVDPSKALNELQPWQVNQEKSRNALSAYEYKDIYGRPIAEPDLTNPTRNRWERPLDTIRAFQDSIDRGYRGSTYEDTPTPAQSTVTGRSIYGRNAGAGGYYDQMPPHTPNRMGDSATPMSNSSGEDQTASYGAMTGNHLNDNMARGGASRPRGQSGGSYPDTGYGESVNHGSRGGSSGNVEASGDAPWGNNNAWSNGASGSNNPWGQHNGAPPAPQVQAEAPQQRNVISLSQSAAAAAPAPAPVEPEEKRKSWLGRRRKGKK